MNKNTTRTIRNKAFRFVGLFLVVGVLLGISSSDVFAQVPPANTQIGNQASATYVDNGGNPQSITSNTVQTIVQQVAGVDISNGITTTVSPGGQISFPHTITNTGNGVDSFVLSTLEGSGDFDFDNIVIYADEGGDGVPDNFTPITITPNIDPPGTANGNTYGIVIVADIPTTAGEGDSETIQIKATSAFNSSVADSTTNTTNVDEDAVINVQKNRDKQFVEVADTVTYTFNYAESGVSSNATNLLIKDPLPAGVTYVPGSGVWSGATGQALTDGSGETASGVQYEYVTGGVQDSVIVQIANINAGSNGYVSFKVTVDASTEGQTISNVGSFSHSDSPTPVNTNPANITVNENYDIESIGADTVFVTSAEQGSIVNFLNVFVNTGTAQDRYNIELSESTFPFGVTPTFYQVDANGQPTSTFQDTNNDGIDDTGLINPGDTVRVIWQLNLPSGQSGGPFSVKKTLTSVNDPNASDFHVDALGEISTPTVDITNGSEIGGGSETGVGEGPETNPVTVVAANPGTIVNFTLYINNTSSQDDEYDLSYAIDTTAAGDLLNPGTLPTDWTASFRDPNNGNSVITSTGTITAGSFKEVTLRVNVPAGYQPGQIQIYARALSQITGAKDIKHEAINVQTVRLMSLVSNQTAQVSPGGSVDYLHTLTINSNVDENVGGGGSESDLQLELTNSVPTGWTAVIYWDTDGNGSVSGVDSLLTSAASPTSVDLPPSVGVLEFGDQLKFIIQVTASTGLNDGATQTTSLTISDSNSQLASKVNTDQTEVQAGRLSIDKYQAADSLGGPATFSKSSFNVLPGDTVWYKIVVTNDGSEPVTNVVVQDNVPSFTTISTAASLTIDNGSIPSLALDGLSPGPGQTGVVKVSANQLDPTEQFTIIFAVKVDD
jgi:uncharacterized repeat protein (TIGR01451 family)